MAKMCITPGTSNFYAPHTVRPVFDFDDCIRTDHSKEARPPTAGVELRIAFKELLPAANAGITTHTKFRIEYARKWSLRAAFSSDLVSQWAEL